jgi:hypothetical protein
MEIFQPVETGRDQESLYLAAADIVDIGLPVPMESLARIRVLVQGRAVEPRHAMGIGRKMRRHPVDNDADIGAMAGIHEAGKAFRWAEPRTRCKQAERLIPP